MRTAPSNSDSGLRHACAEEGEIMTKKQKVMLGRIIVSFLLYLGAIILSIPGFLVFLVPYLAWVGNNNQQ